MRNWILLPLMLLGVANAHAAQESETKDVQASHIINAVYDKNSVYYIYPKVGRATLIELEADEFLNLKDKSALGMGDADGWSIGVKSNSVMIKPKAAKPETNIIIVTNKRSYVFDLKMADKQHLATYLIRFSYPDTTAIQAAKTAQDLREKDAMVRIAEQKEQERKQFVADKTKDRPTLNTAYSWVGKNQLLKPNNVWDNGRFTYLTYDNAAALPNFYKVTPDNTEALVNQNIEGNTVVLQEVLPRIRVRLGNDVIELVNTNYVAPKFNKTQTGDFDSVRVEKGMPQ